MDRLRDFVLDHRRPVAAALAAAAVIVGLRSVQPDVPAGVDVLVAARDLSSGQTVGPDDVDEVTWPAGRRPTHLLDADDLEGRRVAGPLRRGEPLTDRRLIDPRDLPGGTVLTMVRVDDPASALGLRVGDRVDVVAADDDAEATVVASGAEVALLPGESDQGTAAVGVVTDRDDALALAAAAVDARLAVLVTG